MDKQIVSIKRSVATASLAVALLVGGALSWAISSGGSPVLGATRPVTLKLASPNPAQSPATLGTGFADVVAPLLPAVVNISTSKVVQTSSRFQGGQNPFGDDPFFRQFFGDQGNEQPTPRSQREHSLGSGVIVNPDGYILTNNHVVEGASDIQVSLNDKRQLKATVVGTDPRTDIAVLKIPATGLASVTLGDSTKLRVGDIVLAIGDPFGVGETVTMGIVSATGRQVGISAPGGYEDFIQTDASINPGNSGGALVNTRGELVGINTAILSNGGGGNQGIGFAVPVAMARHIMEQILKTGKVTRGYLGVSIQEVTPELAKAFNLPNANGTLIGDVTPDSPGAKAGLQKGDVVTAIDGTPVSDYNELRLRISQMAPGSTVKLDVIRGGQKKQLTATLVEYPTEKAEASSTPAGQEGKDTTLEGVQVGALTPDVAEQLKLTPATHGVVVTNVDPDSSAAEAGLKRGDVIQEVNRKSVANVMQFRQAVRDAGKEPVLLLVNRAGTTLFTVVNPQ
jgi:Do/DeqQ family serine protease